MDSALLLYSVQLITCNSSNRSKEWEHYSHDDVYNTGLINESEFDFWISMADVMVYFETLYITHQAFDKITGTTIVR